MIAIDKTQQFDMIDPSSCIQSAVSLCLKKVCYLYIGNPKQHAEDQWMADDQNADPKEMEGQNKCPLETYHLNSEDGMHGDSKSWKRIAEAFFQ